MDGRVSYKTVAINLRYFYSKSFVAIMQHMTTTATSVLQNGIFKIQNVTIWLVFPNPVTNIYTHSKIAVTCLNTKYIVIVLQVLLAEHSTLKPTENEQN